MWIENSTYQEELERVISNREVFGPTLEGKTVLVTGATGLLGHSIVNALLYFGCRSSKPPKVLACVRNVEKAKQLYCGQLRECGQILHFVVGDITEPLQVEDDLDYIIHGASQTSSAAFVNHPVETIDTAITGTRNMLELARKKQVTSMVYLSSMEAYGFSTAESPLPETAPALFDSMAVRSCYPESKRMCESMCSAYTSEYAVPVKVVRLAQTFGLGVNRDDGRVFADFARKAWTGEDIIMYTSGSSCRMYLYTMDAVTAILTILLKGESGSCYNAANQDTYCSVREMAELVSRVLSGGHSKVILQLGEKNIGKYSPEHKLRLDTRKLEQLGWRAEYGLEEMYKRMVKGF